METNNDLIGLMEDLPEFSVGGFRPIGHNIGTHGSCYTDGKNLVKIPRIKLGREYEQMTFSNMALISKEARVNRYALAADMKVPEIDEQGTYLINVKNLPEAGDGFFGYLPGVVREFVNGKALCFLDEEERVEGYKLYSEQLQLAESRGVRPFVEPLLEGVFERNVVFTPNRDIKIIDLASWDIIKNN